MEAGQLAELVARGYFWACHHRRKFPAGVAGPRSIRPVSFHAATFAGLDLLKGKEVAFADSDRPQSPFRVVVRDGEGIDPPPFGEFFRR